MRIMALDIGRARTGVALSDPTGTIAQPLVVLESRDLGSLAAALGALIEEHGVERMVVGIPFSLDGRRGPMAYWVEGVRRQLAARLPVPLEPWDERLSSVSAERALRESGAQAAKHPFRDAVAAAIVLQGYLERLRLLETGTP